MKTLEFAKSVVRPGAAKPTDRRAWSIPIAGVWQPFFLATNAEGETAMSSEALGAPLRLGKEKDGSIKFSPSGRPVIRVVKEFADQVRFARDNYVFALNEHTAEVRKEKSKQYKAEVERARAASEPLVEADQAALDAYYETIKAAQEATQATTAALAPDRELVAA